MSRRYPFRWLTGRPSKARESAAMIFTWKPAAAARPMVEWVTSKRMNEVEDGKIEVIGPEITDVPAGSQLAAGHQSRGCRPRICRTITNRFWNGRFTTSSTTPRASCTSARETSPGCASANRPWKKASG